MGNFYKDNKGGWGGGGKAAKRGGFGGRGGDRGERPEMHPATCAECGKSCEVPFRPTSSRPVFCRECFNRDDDGDSNRSERRNFEKPRFEKSYDKPTRAPENNKDQYKEQFERLNFKMDNLLKVLSQLIETKGKSEVYIKHESKVETPKKARKTKKSKV